MGMVATSCQQEVDLGVKASGELVEVSLNVQTPTMANRAYSDGATATHLQYAVYNEAGVILNDLTVENATINGSTTVNLQLVTGNTYSVLFWAAAPNAPYTVDLANKSMEVSYTGAVCSDEARDAFYKYHTFTVSGAQTETIELRRPFAQLNIGTNDYDEATNAGLTVTHAKVATSAYTTLDLATGAVDGLTEVEFAYAAAPTSETFPVDDYQYLAMNYLLMAADKETVEVTFYYATDENGANAKSRTVGSIPVQRNYRTNLYGALFTSNVDVNVEIKPEYNEPSHDVEAPVIVAVSSKEELVEAIGNPDVTAVVLNEDIEFDGAITRANEAAATIANKDFVLDGNGKTLTFKSSRAIDIVADAAAVKHVTIKNLTIKHTDSYFERGINFNNTNGTLVVENVKFEGEKYPSYAINLPGSSDGAKVTIKNSHIVGNIALNVWGENMKIDVIDTYLSNHDTTEVENYETVKLNNDGATSAEGTVINIKGGKVVAYDQNGDPCYATGNATAYGQINISETTEVVGGVFRQVAIVAYDNSDCFYGVGTLAGAIAKCIKTNGASVRLTSDIVLEEPLTIKAGESVVLDLCGHTVSAVDNATASYGLITNQGNLTVVGPGKLQLTATNNRGWSAYSSVISNTVGGNLVVDGGVVIEHLGGTAMAYGIDNLTNGKGTKAVTTVKNATVKSTYRAVRQFLNGTEAFNELYVEAGAVIESTGGNKAIWMQSPSKNANSGKLVVEAGAQLKSNVYLDGADSNGLVLDVNIAKSALVDGATINVELPAGYEVVEENGVCTVVLYTAVSTAAELAAAIKAGGKYALANDIALDTPIQIDGKDFVLDGKGHKIGQSSEYPAEGTAVAALIHPIGGNVVVKNVVFDGVKTDAAIRTAGTELLLDNVTVKNCNHSKDQGLLRLLGKSTIKNSTFVNNTCKMVVSLNFDGNGTVTSPQVVENCVFEGNTCNTTAVVYYAEGGSVTIDGNKFVNNTLNVSNGATVYLGFKKNCTVTNNVFDGNTVTATSTRSSGGLMVGNAAVVTGNCFVNNTVTVNGQTGYGNDVCASPYYAAIDLSGNYWGGNAPVEGDDYYKEFNNYEVIINDYLTTNPLQ